MGAGTVVSYSYLRVHYLQVMSNLLYYYGMCGLVKELLLMRYFSKVSFRSGSIKFDTWFLTNIGLIGYI